MIGLELLRINGCNEKNAWLGYVLTYNEAFLCLFSLPIP